MSTINITDINTADDNITDINSTDGNTTNNNITNNNKTDNDTFFKNTIISNSTAPLAIETASSFLKNGGLVVFPTETVYGLGADALSKDAAKEIYAAKNRPSDNPLIVHIANLDDIYRLASTVPEKAFMLMEAFWPGPLTIILQKNPIVPEETTGGLDTVAIRMPSHPTALALLKESGILIAAPSANISGRPSPTNASHVVEDMFERVDMILDGGSVGIGIESTIVDLSTDTPTILRPGYVTKSMIENIIGPVYIDPALNSETSKKPKAPGMKYTHYAPKGELYIVESTHNPTNESHQESADVISTNGVSSDVVSTINKLVEEKAAKGHKVAVLSSKENIDQYICDNVLVLGSHLEGETIAANLYKCLRECDRLGAEYIYSESFNDVNLGGAIMNRLLKAAGHRIITTKTRKKQHK